MTTNNLENVKAGDELVDIQYNRFDGFKRFTFKKVLRTTKTLIIFDEAGTPVLRKNGRLQGNTFSSQQWEVATPEHHAEEAATELRMADVKLVSDTFSNWRACVSLDPVVLNQIANILRGAAQ